MKSLLLVLVLLSLPLSRSFFFPGHKMTRSGFTAPNPTSSFLSSPVRPVRVPFTTCGTTFLEAKPPKPTNIDYDLLEEELSAELSAGGDIPVDKTKPRGETFSIAPVVVQSSRHS